MPRTDTLHALLDAQARQDRQLTFIDGEQEQRLSSFQSLRERALGVLGALQQREVQAGDAMLIVLADNDHFLEMFWACVLGGIVPVPLAPGASDEHRRKLFRVTAQFTKPWLYTDPSSMDRLEAYAHAQGLAGEWDALRSRSFMAGSLQARREPGVPVSARPGDLAFIQFSSGSTGDPKGVRLTHGNLTANIAGILEAGGFSDRDVALSWMPLSHDMGLIGFHLVMLAGGISHALMRTELFARRPLLWLDMATRLKATVLCSPNFGYQHYLRQYELKQPAELDLSAVRLVFNGAEPISPDLCRRFTQTMSAHGLSPTAMFPVYGLAEASLAVSFPEPGAPLQSLRLDRGTLRVGEPAMVAAGDDKAPAASVDVVLLGRAVPGCQILIADDAGAPVGDKVVGRVLIRGDNVTEGYQPRPGESLSPRGDGWLDTGDLGLTWDGQLVITGRAKDLVIINGQNLYPHDIERLAEDVAGIEPGRVAAAGVRPAGADTEQLAVFVLHRASTADLLPTALALQERLIERTGLESVVVVPVRQLPKTTSGKLQRHALARAFEQGEFDAVTAELRVLLEDARRSAGQADDGAGTLARLLAACRPLVPHADIDADTNLLSINLNSLTLARIHEAIEREFPQRIEATDLFDYPALKELAAYLDSQAA